MSDVVLLKVGDYRKHTYFGKIMHLDYENKIIIEGAYLDMVLFIADTNVVPEESWTIFVDTLDGASGVASTPVNPKSVRTVADRMRQYSKKHDRILVEIKHNESAIGYKGSLFVSEGIIVPRKQVERKWRFWQ